MNKVLLLFGIIVLAFSSVAMADHIGVYSDASGSSCNLAPGFSPNTAVVHKFSLGATQSRFKVTLPPGSSFFAFSSTYPTVGIMTSDLTVTYSSQCLTGSFLIGNIVAILVPGTINTLPANTFSNIFVTDCNFVENGDASGGGANIGNPNYCPVWFPVVATEGATWGSVKALYR